MSSPATTVHAYLQSLPAERRAVVRAVRDVVRANLPAGFEEGMQYGMISYHVPLTRYPTTYNGQPLAIAALAAQKNYYSLYLMGIYGDGEFARWFEDAFERAGKKLDKGKSCVRFKALADLPLEVIARAVGRVSVAEFIALYEASRPAAGGARKPRSTAAKKAEPRTAKAARTPRAQSR